MRLQGILGVLGALFVICGSGVSASAAGIEATLKPGGGAHGMFNRPWPTAAKPKVDPVPLHLTLMSTDGAAHQVKVTLSAKDIFGEDAGWDTGLTIAVPADGKPVQQEIPFAAGLGFFRITGACRTESARVPCAVEIGIIPPFHPGARPESFFTSNTSGLKTGEDLLLLQAIGLKVERAHFQPEVKADNGDWLRQTATGAPLPLDFTRQDKAWEETKAHDTWVLPLAGYAFQGPGGAAKSELANRIGMHGPPRDSVEFVNTWAAILKHYPEITTYEFWNEPWIFGWTWAATPEEYRKLQTMWCDIALGINPQYRLLAGNSSMFVRDHIEAFPDCWRGKLQGTTHHPYTRATGSPNWRAGDNLRSIDDGMLTTRRMQLPYYCLTEGGTEYRTPETPEVAADRKRLAELDEKLKAFATPEQKTGAEYQAVATESAGLRTRRALLPDARNNLENATKLVQYFVRTALDGAFMGNAQWEIGYGPQWTRCNTAFAVMAHFLEDRPVVADIWPDNELIWGAVFASPKQVTPEVKALPRAAELAARWNVAVPTARENDATKVAVIWNLTGKSNEKLDTTGTLRIANAEDLRAYDLVGREIPHGWGKLVVPFNQYPVYIVTEKLSVLELRDRIAKATIDHVTAVNFYALSLLRPAADRQYLIVRVENQINREVAGEMTASLPGKFWPAKATFRIPAGKLAEVSIPWPGVTPSPDNQYAVKLEAKLDHLPNVTRQQIVSAAYFVHRTITVDGSLADWDGVVPLVMDSDVYRQGFDPTQYLLNPHLDRPTGTPESKRIVARVYTAYDAGYVYIAAAVNEDSLRCEAGMPVEKGNFANKVALPFKSGMPDGLNHISNQGDALQLSFGFRDRVPGWGRQMNDPYAWKGHFHDVDYSYVAHVSTEGDQFFRLWGPKTPRQDAYQCAAVPGVGPVGGAIIRIVRDETKKLTVYEIAIPRGDIMLFNPLSMDRCRFGFVLCNDERLGDNGLNWGEAAGVFDHWYSGGSYPPTWTQKLPCQTYFGILK